MIASYGQGIVLNIFFGTVINASQGIANQVKGQLGAFATTMMKALNPVIAKSEGAGDRDLMIRASIMGSKISFFLLMIFYVPVLIEMPYIFKVWLKNVPEFAVLFCQLLLIRTLIEQLFLTLNTSISAVGNIRNFQIFSSILWSLPLIISYVLFKFGLPPYFLYLAFLIYSILAGILVLYFSRKNFDLKISHFLKDVVLKCSLSFIITFAISTLPIWFLKTGLIRLILVLIISTISFTVTAWFIGFSSNERIKIKQIVIPFIKKIVQKKAAPMIETVQNN